MRTKQKIMLVEDNPADAFLIEAALKEHGVNCDIDLARDGDSAMRMIRSFADTKECPDLLIVDINIPMISGIDILIRMRDMTECKSIPVIVFTSSHSPSEARQLESISSVRKMYKESSVESFFQIGNVAKEMMQAK